MGVAGLWEVLRPAGQVRSLTELAVEDGFNANPDNHRGFRIGVDASIWFFHATYGREGENPELRTLFFRCCRLLHLPLLPLFVFDGPNRPAVKRGKRVGANAHWLTQGMKNIIDAFGFEWWVAPGEAEAELAYLNRIGVIDAVLSDDVDNFLFGATMVIRNPSNTLSGNRAHPIKNAQGKEDGNHVVTYTADAILSDSSVALSRPGTILIGLLSGGDYVPAGLPGCGQKFATGLARAGFGDSLLKAIHELKGARLDAFLDQWRQNVRNELKTNKGGHLPSKKPSLAASLPDNFPDLPVLMSYAVPLTSEKSKRKTRPGAWRNDADPMKIASLCELYFEWGVKDVIVQRFRTVLWPGIVCRAVRRAVVDEDLRRRPKLSRTHRCDSEEEEGTACHSSPTKQISSTLSSLALSSSSKGSSATSNSAHDLFSSAFTLSSLVRLTSPASPGSSRSSSPSYPSASSSHPLLLEVVSQREHVSTDSTLEYRVLVDPTALVDRAESGVRGLRPPLIGGLFGIDPEEDDDSEQDAESGSDDGIARLETAAGAASKSGKKPRKAGKEAPTTPLRLWLPACMVRAAAPALVEAYEDKVRVREAKKAKRGTKTKTGQGGREKGEKTQKKTGKDVMAEEVEVAALRPSVTKVTVSRAKSRAGRVGGGRRKPKQASEAQDDAYECIDLSAGENLCSSDGESGKEVTVGETKARLKITKARARADVKISKAATTSTMKKFYQTKKPSASTIKSKPTTSRPPAKSSSLNPATWERANKNGIEESTDVDVPHSLSKSSRPLDVLRAKSKSSTVPSKPTSAVKSKSDQSYEKNGSSSSSPPCRSKPALRRPTQLAVQTRRKPLFVDVSDTDSGIEVSEVRGPFSGMVASAALREQVAVDVKISGDACISMSTLVSQKAPSRVVNGVIDLTANRNASTSTIPAPGVNIGTIDPTSIARSSSKLGHTLGPSIFESEAEETSEDGLPTIHRDATKPMKATSATTTSRPAPRPFPMQFASESPVSPCSSRYQKGGNRQNGDDSGDEIIIVDVFTTPRAPSPPRSPTPSPSPVKHQLVRVSPAAPSLSPTHATEPVKQTKPRRRVSLDRDVHASGSERGGTPKSPRKSAAHSSPRHGSCVRGRPSSPTPPVMPTTNSSCGAMLGTDAEGNGASHSHVREGGDSRSACVNHGYMGRKPRVSEGSTIYITSGSEDEGEVELMDGSRGGRVAQVSVSGDRDLDQDGWTDGDVGGWANTGMILSAPPSPRIIQYYDSYT